MIEKNWSSDEIEYLRIHYPSERAVDIAEYLGRTRQSVQHKASRIGVKKTKVSFWNVRSKTQKALHPQSTRIKSGKGYIYCYVPDHPHATKKGFVMEHRLVVEKHIGHYLDPDMDVHHLNGVKTDNRVSNLIVLTHAEHTRLHNLEGRR